MNGNRLAFIEARAKIFALQHARQPVVRTKPNHVLGVHFGKPVAVAVYLGFVAVKDLEDLREIGFRIGVHLFTTHRRARLRYAGGIANHSGEIANQEHRGVPQVLKMLQFAQHHGVAEVKIRSRGIHAEIHAQRLPGFAGVFEFGG